MAKVLVGTVTNQCKDYCWDKFAKQLKGLQMQGHDVLVIDNSTRLQPRKGFKTIHYKDYKKWGRIMYAHNLNLPSDQKKNFLVDVTLECMQLLREEFLKGDYTHLFILESDVFIEKDTVQNLLDMDADVTNYTYLMKLNRFDEFSLCVQATKEGRSRMITPEQGRELINTGVKELGKDMLGDSMLTHCGYGCTLVRREVLEKIDFRVGKMENGRRTFPDSMFHVDVIQEGFSNKLDTDWLPNHENLHNQTLDMIKILNVQKLSRRERRKLR